MMYWLIILLILPPLSLTQELGLSGSDYGEEKRTTDLSDRSPNSEKWIHSVIF